MRSTNQHVGGHRITLVGQPGGTEAVGTRTRSREAKVRPCMVYRDGHRIDVTWFVLRTRAGGWGNVRATGFYETRTCHISALWRGGARRRGGVGTQAAARPLDHGGVPLPAPGGRCGRQRLVRRPWSWTSGHVPRRLVRQLLLFAPGRHFYRVGCGVLAATTFCAAGAFDQLADRRAALGPIPGRAEHARGQGSRGEPARE